jgi:ectoine hydroxylase-related dioxygenase (phytanoyl-CoA dioxygenase family)
MIADPVKIEEIQQRGFAVVSGLLPEKDVPELKAELEKCIREDLERYGKSYVDAWMVQNLMVRGAPFVKVLENEILHAYLSALLTDTCIVYAYTSSSMPAGGSNYSHRVHVDCPRLIPGYMTNVGVMMALDDYSDANGATWFLPGSQTRADTPSKEEFLANARRVYPKAGDAVIFNARTFHMGAVNTTDKPRHAITMNVCRSYMRQRFDYPRLVPKDIIDGLGDVGRRFLGFNVRMPVSLEEYYVPEAQRLYKANQG